MVRAGTQRLGATDRGADLRGRSSRGAARAQVPDSGVGSGWRSLPAGSGDLLWARFACAPTPAPSLKGRGMAWYFISLSFPRRRAPRGGVSRRTLWIPAFPGTPLLYFLYAIYFTKPLTSQAFR